MEPIQKEMLQSYMWWVLGLVALGVVAFLIHTCAQPKPPLTAAQLAAERVQYAQRVEEVTAQCRADLRVARDHHDSVNALAGQGPILGGHVGHCALDSLGRVVGIP